MRSSLEKGGIAEHVVRGEQHRFAQLFLELVVVTLQSKKAPQSFRRYIN